VDGVQEILGVGLAVAAVLLLLTSTFLYYVEKDNDPDVRMPPPACSVLLCVSPT
jgi:hypothetical protein